MSIAEWETDKLIPPGATVIDGGHRFTLHGSGATRGMFCQRCTDQMNTRCALLPECPGKKISDADYLKLVDVQPQKKKTKR